MDFLVLWMLMFGFQAGTKELVLEKQLRFDFVPLDVLALDPIKQAGNRFNSQ